jgi:hypothetical protein
MSTDVAKQFAMQAAANERSIQQQILEVEDPSGANAIELSRIVAVANSANYPGGMPPAPSMPSGSMVLFLRDVARDLILQGAAQLGAEQPRASEHADVRALGFRLQTFLRSNHTTRCHQSAAHTQADAQAAPPRPL